MESVAHPSTVPPRAVHLGSGAPNSENTRESQEHAQSRTEDFSVARLRQPVSFFLATCPSLFVFPFCFEIGWGTGGRREHFRWTCVSLLRPGGSCLKGYILPMGFGVGGGPKRLRRGERGRKNEGGAFLRVSWKRERTSVVAEHGDNSPEGLSEVAHFAVAVR